LRAAVNEKLLLSGYELRADGNVRRAVAAVTIGEAQRRADDMRAELSRRNGTLTSSVSAERSYWTETIFMLF
jgi:hypothetical protein